MTQILARHFSWRRKNGLPVEAELDEKIEAVENKPEERIRPDEVRVLNVRELKRAMSKDEE